MKSFLQRFGSLVSGVLHGFDRLRLRGSKRQLCNPGGFFSFLSHLQVPLQHYKSYAKTPPCHCAKPSKPRPSKSVCTGI